MSSSKKQKDVNKLFRGTEPSLWQFWEHGITSSFVESFLTCREQTRLSYVRGLTSTGMNMALDFGTCFHWMLEQVYGDMQRTRQYLHQDSSRLKLARKLADEYQQKWTAEHTSKKVHLSQSQRDHMEMVLGLAEVVLPGYLVRWSGDFLGGKYKYPNKSPKPKEWLSLEEVFEVPYAFKDGRKTVIRGRRDGVYQDYDDLVRVFDTKCRSVINHDDALDTLPFDFQQMLYLYATKIEHKKKGLPPPKGTVMNIVRRPGQRRGQHEGLADFLKRVAREVQDPKRFDWYYVRYSMRVAKNELDAWKETQLDPIMEDIRGWWEGRHPHYMTAKNLITKYGRCQLFLPLTKGEEINCIRREHAFSELAEV